MSRTRLASVALCAALAAAGAAPGARAEVVEWLPAASPSYAELEQLRRDGVLDTTVTLAVRPMARADVARLVAFALAHHPESAGDASLVRLHREFSRELVDWGFAPAAGYTRPLVLWAPGSEPPKTGPGHADARLRIIPYLDAAFEQRPDGDGRLADHSRAGLRFGVELGPVLLYQDLFAGRVDGGQAYADPLVEDTDFIHYVEDTYVSLRTRWIDASLGRLRQGWGPGRTGTLLWSEGADPTTNLTWGGALWGGRLRGTAVHADVDAVRGERLAAHRLDFALSPRLTFGVAEAARYTSSHWEPLYVVGVVPYTLVQRMLTQDYGAGGTAVARNNVMVSADARWQAARGQTLYGELLLDDLTFTTSGTPTRIGYQAGWQGSAAPAGLDVSWQVEYTRVYRYVYAVYYGEDFIFHDAPLGYPKGPDSRTLAGGGTLDLSPDWSLSALVTLADHGEGELGESYDPDGPAASGSELAGVVEHARALQVGGLWTPRDGVVAGLGWGYRWQTDAGHIAGQDREGWFGRASLYLRY